MDYEIIKNYENDRWFVDCDYFVSKACFVTYFRAQEWANKIKRSGKISKYDELKIFVKYNEPRIHISNNHNISFSL